MPLDRQPTRHQHWSGFRRSVAFGFLVFACLFPLGVLGQPTITTQPVNQNTVRGATVTFTVAATGNGPLTYQWRKNGVNISGANGAAYTIANVQPAEAGSYSVVVSDSIGATGSSVVGLLVTDVNILPFADNFRDRVPIPGVLGLAGVGRGNNRAAT